MAGLEVGIGVVVWVGFVVGKLATGMISVCIGLQLLVALRVA
jgi:hypothetical protein